MSLATVVAILALAAALAAIPRRTRKPAALVSLLAILASLTAVAYATAQVAQPAQESSGPLVLVVPEGLDKPDDYHLPLEVWRAEHPLYVRSSEYGVEECLDCHDEPDTFCNQCHSYVGSARIEVAALPGAPGTSTSAGAVESPTFADNIEPLLNERCGACHIRRTWKIQPGDVRRPAHRGAAWVANRGGGRREQPDHPGVACATRGFEHPPDAHEPATATDRRRDRTDRALD
ncbi:MAG: hypothetical protein ACE5FI_14470 [Anaerolineales bacterium]